MLPNQMPFPPHSGSPTASPFPPQPAAAPAAPPVYPGHPGHPPAAPAFPPQPAAAPPVYPGHPPAAPAFPPQPAAAPPVYPGHPPAAPAFAPQGAGAPGLFDGLGDATLDSRYPKLNGDRSYVVEIESITYGGKSNHDQSDLVPVTMKVIASDDPQRPPGTMVSWVHKLRTKKGGRERFQAKCLEMAAAVYGYQPTEENLAPMRPHIEAEFNAAIGPENKWRGKKALIQTTTIHPDPSKNRPHAFIDHNWLPAPAGY